MQRLGAACALLLVAVTASCAPAVRNYNGDGVRLLVSNESGGAVNVAVSAGDSVLNLGAADRFAYRTFDLDSAPASGVVVIVAGGTGAVLHTDTIRPRNGNVIDVRVGQAPHRLRWWTY